MPVKHFNRKNRRFCFLFLFLFVFLTRMIDASSAVVGLWNHWRENEGGRRWGGGIKQTNKQQQNQKKKKEKKKRKRKLVIPSSVCADLHGWVFNRVTKSNTHTHPPPTSTPPPTKNPSNFKSFQQFRDVIAGRRGGKLRGALAVGSWEKSGGGGIRPLKHGVRFSGTCQRPKQKAFLPTGSTPAARADSVLRLVQRLVRTAAWRVLSASLMGCFLCTLLFDSHRGLSGWMYAAGDDGTRRSWSFLSSVQVHCLKRGWFCDWVLCAVGEFTVELNCVVTVRE